MSAGASAYGFYVSRGAPTASLACRVAALGAPRRVTKRPTMDTALAARSALSARSRSEPLGASRPGHFPFRGSRAKVGCVRLRVTSLKQRFVASIVRSKTR